MTEVDKLLAEVEPAAWRWKHPSEPEWRYGPAHPGHDEGVYVVEELVPASLLTSEREARQHAEKEANRLLGMIIGREELKKHLGINADKASVDVAKKFMIERNEAVARAEAAEARLKAAHAVIAPFVTDWADENGWTDKACQNDRIVDWFGPSDFRAAKQFMEDENGNQ